MKYSALIGNPVEHSVSPELFAQYAESVGFSYSHLKILVDQPRKINQVLHSLELLGFSGINVTIPYKETVMKHIDVLDESAEKCGAVNTVVFKNGKRIGYNTDGLGAIRAIEYGGKKITRKETALIIGAGGAARAIVAALSARVRHIQVANRTPERAKRLARDLNSKLCVVETIQYRSDVLRRAISNVNIIVNATPVGTSPQKAQTPVPGFSSFKDSYAGKVFFDCIYSPPYTTFLKIAKKRGARVSSGLYMMIFQGVVAFELWTKKPLPTMNFRSIHNELLKKF